MNRRMNLRRLIERLLHLRRRVRGVYLMLGERAEFPAGLRAVWKFMANEKDHQRVFLERSAGLLNFVSSLPEVCEVTLRKVEAQLATAEAVARQPSLSVDEALRHALILEGSELANLVNAWVQGFSPALESLLHAHMPDEEALLRRLVEATQEFSADPTVHDQAETVRSARLEQRVDCAKEGTRASCDAFSLSLRGVEAPSPHRQIEA